MKSGLERRRILVTGAAGGIGQAICRALAREGAVPLIHFRSSAEAAENLAKEIEQETGIAAELYSADVAQEESVRQMFERIRQAGGATDLVANAGIYPARAVPVREMTLEQWNRTMAVNLEARPETHVG